MQKEKRGWMWHWQDLRENHHGRGVHGRAWFRHRPRGRVAFEWHLPGSWGVRLAIGGMTDQLNMSLACGLFEVFFSIDDWPWLYPRLAFAGYQGREISLDLHDGALWWRFWMAQDEWLSSTPRWRDGSLNFLDFLIGEPIKTEIEWDEVQTTIPLPEATYPATVRLFTQAWHRSRWPWSRRWRRATITVPGGVPIPGKGENAWDCDDSAMDSMTISADDVHEAVAEFIGTVLRHRERYGGAGWQPEMS